MKEPEESDTGSCIEDSDCIGFWTDGYSLRVPILPDAILRAIETPSSFHDSALDDEECSSYRGTSCIAIQEPEPEPNLTLTVATLVPSTSSNEVAPDLTAICSPNTPLLARESPTSLSIFSTMHPEAHILLFTPVLVPSGMGKSNTQPGRHHNDMQYQNDPFEVFGRELNKHHRGVRHVPYVPTVGFTEVHEAFLMQADAVITVVCEPAPVFYKAVLIEKEIEQDERSTAKKEPRNGDRVCETVIVPCDPAEAHRRREGSIKNQMSFAESALDSMKSKEASATNGLVLVRCGANDMLFDGEKNFVNVVKTDTYNAEVAEELANTIFSLSRQDRHPRE